MVDDVIAEVVKRSIVKTISEIEDDVDSPYLPAKCIDCEDKNCRRGVLIKAANMKIARQAQLN